MPDPPPEIPPKPSTIVSTSSSKLNQSPTKSSGERLPTDAQVRGRNLWDTPESSSRRPRDPHHIKHSGDRQSRVDQDHSKPSSSRKQTSTRSPSPKRIISTPPTTGDIHRPVPTPPKPSKPYGNSLQVHPSNYENHDDGLLQHPQSSVSPKDNSHTRYGGSENMPPSPRRAQIPIPDPEESQRKQSNGFSLKSWLRKENVKSRRTNQEQLVSPKEPEHQNKSNTAFVKLRNTVVQKFGNNVGARRGHDSSSPESKHRSAVDHGESRHHSPNKYLGNRDSSSGRSRSRSPSGDRNPTKRPGHQDSDMEAEEEVAFYNGRVSKPRDKSPTKNVPPAVPAKPQAEVKPNFPSFGIIDPNTGSYRPAEKPKHQSDLNNNEQGSPRVVHSKRVRGRDRAPLALGSNISLSDPYPRPDASTNLVSQRQSWDVNPQSTMPSSARAQRQFNTIAGSSPVNPIPTYRAKVIHMYENQSKYDASEAVPPGVYHEAPQDLHSARGAHRYNTMGPKRTNNYLLMQSKEDQHSHPHLDRAEDRFAEQRRQQQGDLKRMPQDKGMQPMGVSYQGNNPSQQPQLNPRDKTAAHAQSITSLIERFEAGKGPPPPGYQGATVAMTSTPVTQRKNLQMSLQPESAGRDGQRQMHDDHIQNPFPLLDGVTQAASTGSSKPHGDNQRSSNPGGDSRHHGDSNPRASHPQYHGHSAAHPGFGYDQQRRPEQDEGYRDQLRRALNNNNVTVQRYTKPSPGYSGHSSTSHRSPPQMMRAMPVKPSVYHHGGVTV